MPDWYEDAAKRFIEAAKTDLSLYREILRAIEQIRRNPLVGDLIMPDFRVYHDPQGRFWLTYNFNPHIKQEEKQLLIVNLTLH